jgi:hypothetical protein
VVQSAQGTLNISCHRCQFSGYGKAGTKAKRLIEAAMTKDDDAEPPPPPAPSPAPKEPKAKDKGAKPPEPSPTPAPSPAPKGFRLAGL